MVYIISFYNRLPPITWPSFFIAVFTAFIAWLVYKIVEERLSPLSRIPSPEGRLPLIGHLLVVSKKGGLETVFTEWRDKYGPMVVFSPGYGIGVGDYSVVPYDPDVIKQILVTEAYKYNRSAVVINMFPGVANGLFGSSGKEHARQRKLINPAFKYTKLKCFVPTFVECSANLVKLWTQKIQTSPIIDVEDDICHLALDITGKTSFGYDFNATLGTESEMSVAVTLLLNGGDFGYFVRSNIIPFYKYLPLPDNYAIKKATKIVDGTVLKIINERRIIREQGKGAGHKDLLNLLFAMYDEETGKGFDDEELRAQVFSFMLAGHETTSTSLSWTLYELSKQPEIQEKIRKELKDVLLDDEELTWDKIEKLEYLNCVTKESLRRHSPVTMIGRETNTTLSLVGYEIPKGTTIYIPLDALHLSPKYWDNPNEFNPDRFMKKDDTIKPYGFLPFSVGPRICIGNKFAMIEMKVILLSLLQKFQFTAIPGFEVKPLMKLTTKPDPSVKVKVTLVKEQ